MCLDWMDMCMHMRVWKRGKRGVYICVGTLGVYKNVTTEDAPVFITNGVGGTEEGLARNWILPDEPWVAYKAAHWGFGSIE